MKYKTVREGEQAVIFNHLGEGRLCIGPERVFLFRERLEKLRQYTANQYEYLVVRLNTGLVKHLQGPCSMFNNPLEHETIRVEESIKIDSNHLIVVYRQLKDNSVQRRIIQGPTIFVPEPGEWMHEFAWHGEDTQDRGRMIPAHNKFKQLAAIPDQFYYNVKEVRTTDDTMLTVKLMLFFELQDVLKMLEATHDPIADMMNAVCADVIALAGKLPFQEFLEKTNQLSSLETFPQLTQRAERIGYRIAKVVYRGYHASPQLQAMQDNAIQSRTELRFNAEFQEQQQRLTDFKLKKEQARTKMKQDMEHQKQKHRQQVERLKQNHGLQLKEKSQLVTLECEEIENAARLENERNIADHRVSFLENLSGLDVDVTRYLVSQGRAPVDQEYRVVSS